jgi:predicted dehydrogenase
MLRVGIVGCGKIADQHAEEITQLPGCKIVGVCDREELMARQLQERFKVPASFSEVQDLLLKANPDVVHITSPPQSHYPVGKLCLDAGRHVYIEKPFTITSDEAEELVSLAETKNLRLTVGHNAQFSHAASRMRKLVAEGYLGGPPAHLEAYYCYDLGDPSYARALLGDSHHWVRRLPGGLLQNTISHGICKLSEFLKNDDLEIIARGFVSPFLRSLGETKICDELRVIIYDGTATAFFTFSSQMRPSQHELRIYGRKNGLIMDERRQTLIKLRGASYKSYLEQFLPPWDYAKQYIGNSLGNMRRFLRAEFQTGYGMRTLIQAFYRSITEGAPIPIPYDEILRTSRIMDEIFLQLGTSEDGARTRQVEYQH